MVPEQAALSSTMAVLPEASSADFPWIEGIYVVRIALGLIWNSNCLDLTPGYSLY